MEVWCTSHNGENFCLDVMTEKRLLQKRESLFLRDFPAAQETRVLCQERKIRVTD